MIRRGEVWTNATWAAIAWPKSGSRCEINLVMNRRCLCVVSVNVDAYVGGLESPRRRNRVHVERVYDYMLKAGACEARR